MPHIPLGWSRQGRLVCYRFNGGTEAYDEAGLRRCIANYVSNESRTRFADDERFMDNRMFLDGLKHLMVGLELFFVDSTRPQ